MAFIPSILWQMLDMDHITTIFFGNKTEWKKYMKFPMFKKETKDREDDEDPFRAVNFRIDEQGVMDMYPNDKAFHLFIQKKCEGKLIRTQGRTV